MPIPMLFRLLLIALCLISSTALAEEHRVKMLNQGAEGVMVFEPGYLAIAPGDTVTFVATDPAHNSRSVLTPEGGADWQGKNNEEISVTLNEAGVYIYQCDPHLPLAMVGVIQVGGDSSNLEAARAKAAQMRSSLATNKDRLDQYLDQVE